MYLSFTSSLHTLCGGWLWKWLGHSSVRIFGDLEVNVFETEVVHIDCTVLWRRHFKSFTRGYFFFHGRVEENNLSSFEGWSWFNVLLFPKRFVFVWLVISFFRSINEIPSFSACKNSSIQHLDHSIQHLDSFRCGSNLPVLHSVIYYTGTKADISQGFLPVLKWMTMKLFSSFISKKGVWHHWNTVLHSMWERFYFCGIFSL